MALQLKLQKPPYSIPTYLALTRTYQTVLWTFYFIFFRLPNNFALKETIAKNLDG